MIASSASSVVTTHRNDTLAWFFASCTMVSNDRLVISTAFLYL
jgi:hypothetical protein